MRNYQAALGAGYSPETAFVLGAELVAIPTVAANPGASEE